MHTYRVMDGAIEWVMFVNGDFSGDVTVVDPYTGEDIVIPFDVFEGLVAESRRRRLISKLEEMSVEQLLC